MSAMAPQEPASLGRARLVDVTRRFEAMGGTVRLRVAVPDGAQAAGDRDLRRVARRIESWAARVTRFDERSELTALNREAAGATSLISPTLGDLFMRTRAASELTDGLVDVTLLEARLAAEHGGEHDGGRAPARGAWWLERTRRRVRLRREGHVTFDPDGVGKGWIADRALALFGRYPAAMVDADGDIAWRPGEREEWGVAVADPHGTEDLALLVPPPGITRSFGVATSGTTVHRWEHADGWAHHLIDPRTGACADTDVVQATVAASDALSAEALAKAAVIAGSEDGLRLLERVSVPAAVLLLQSGELIALTGSESWLR